MNDQHDTIQTTEHEDIMNDQHDTIQTTEHAQENNRTQPLARNEHLENTITNRDNIQQYNPRTDRIIIDSNTNTYNSITNNNINRSEDIQHNEMQRNNEMNASDINRNNQSGQQQNDNNGVNETENNQGNRNKSTTTPTINWTQQTIPQYDTTPNRRNEAWGLSINNLPPTIFRVYFQNINGRQFRTNKSRWQPHLQCMKDKGITISGFAKTNTNWYYKHIKRQISSKPQAVFDNYSIAFSENRFNPPDRSSYLPGECLQLCTDHCTSRMIRTLQNPRKMGRWTGQQFRLKDGKTLSVITAYQPC
jgi:hypothetical protein